MANFSFYAGDKKLVTITVLDASSEAVDIAGATIRWQAARSTADDDLVLQKSTGDSPGDITITDPSNGVFVVTLNEVDTDALSGLYYYEAEVVISGDISTVIAGYFYVIPTLIRA